jgi:hypothetical protein
MPHSSRHGQKRISCETAVGKTRACMRSIVNACPAQVKIFPICCVDAYMNKCRPTNSSLITHRK